MNKLSRILLLLDDDGTIDSPAFLRAVELSRRSGAELRICGFAYQSMIDVATGMSDPSVHRRPKDRYLHERQEPLDRAQARLTAEGLRVSGEVIWSREPHEAAIAKVIEFDPDLVIRNLTRAPNLLGVETIQGDVWRLARFCPAPLMLVQASSPTLPLPIAAAVDTSQYTADAALNQEVVRVAASIGDCIGSALELVHVFPYIRSNDELQDSYERMLEQDSQRFNEFAEKIGVSPVHRHWRNGITARELLAYVQAEKCQLLVVGSVYRNAFSRLFIGSTAEAAIEGLPCDVVLVKPRDFLSELNRHKDVKALCAEYGISAPTIPASS